MHKHSKKVDAIIISWSFVWEMYYERKRNYVSTNITSLRLGIKLLILKFNFQLTLKTDMAFHTTRRRMKVILDSQWIRDDIQIFPGTIYICMLNQMTGISKEPRVKVWVSLFNLSKVLIWNLKY